MINEEITPSRGDDEAEKTSENLEASETPPGSKVEGKTVEEGKEVGEQHLSRIENILSSQKLLSGMTCKEVGGDQLDDGTILKVLRDQKTTVINSIVELNKKEERTSVTLVLEGYTEEMGGKKVLCLELKGVALKKLI